MAAPEDPPRPPQRSSPAKASARASSTPATTTAAATTCSGETAPGSTTEAASAAGIGLIAVAVVVAEAAPWSSRSQTQMAVTTMSATDTRWRATIWPLHSQGTNGAKGSRTRQLPTYSTPMSWRAGARRVSSLLMRACPAFATAASDPNRTAITCPTDLRGARCGFRDWNARVAPWYRFATGLQTVPVSSSIDTARQRRRPHGGRDADRIHGAARTARPHGPVGRPEDLDLPQDHRRPRWRPLGRGGQARRVLRRRSQRVLHPLPPVDRRPQRVPPRQGRRRGHHQGPQRPGRRRRDPARRLAVAARASTGTASCPRSRTSPPRPTASSPRTPRPSSRS